MYTTENLENKFKPNLEDDPWTAHAVALSFFVRAKHMASEHAARSLFLEPTWHPIKCNNNRRVKTSFAQT